MVAKKCPDCDQTLPVACKSCPCGHIFISKKQLSIPLQDKTETGEGNHRDQRLRPEVPKLANKDYDYNYGKMDKVQDINDDKEAVNTRVLISPSTSQTLHLVVRSYPQTSKSSEMTFNMPTQEAHILGEGYIISKRKRGRPKGSKNKPKPVVQPGEEPSSHDDTQTQNTESGDPTKRKRGRPKGSKNKPKDPLLHLNKDDYSSDPQDEYYQEPYLDTMPHISKEKAISYSIVLSDINQKMLKQSSMNFV